MLNEKKHEREYSEMLSEGKNKFNVGDIFHRVAITFTPFSVKRFKNEKFVVTKLLNKKGPYDEERFEAKSIDKDGKPQGNTVWTYSELTAEKVS